MGGTMGRRSFLAALSAGTLAALVAAVESARGDTHPAASPASKPEPLAPVAPLHPESITKVLADGAVTRLPGQGPYLALTVDDGTNSDVVGAYVELARATGLRMTFFPNGQNQS